MNSECLVVMGAVAAGLSVASRARRVNPRLEILVYEKEPDISYSACGFPYFLAGLVRGAEALKRLGLEVTLLERSATLFEAVDEEIVAPIEAELSRQGVRVHKSAAATALLGDREGRLGRVVWEGQQSGSQLAEVDCAVLATGVRPRVKLAQQMGIRIGWTGAIAVNEFMETSEAAVFAAGDCAEILHLVSDPPFTSLSGPRPINKVAWPGRTQPDGEPGFVAS